MAKNNFQVEKVSLEDIKEQARANKTQKPVIVPKYDSPIEIDPSVAALRTHRKYTDKAKEQIDKYYTITDQIAKNKVAQETEKEIEKLQNPKTWYEKLVPEGTNADKWNPIGWSATSHDAALELVGLDDTMFGEAVSTTLHTLADFTTATAVFTIGKAGALADIPDWRLAEAMPTGGRMVGGVRQLYSIVASKDWTEEEIEKFNKRTEQIIATGENEGLNKVLKTIDNLVFKPMDKYIGDKSITNPLSEWADDDAAKRAARTIIESEFQWDNDVALLSEEGAKYAINTVLQGGPSVASSLVAAPAILGIVSKLSKLNNGLARVKTVNGILKVSNAAQKGKLIAAAGITLEGSFSEGSQIGRDVERQKLLLLADKYTEENPELKKEWVEYQEKLKRKVYLQGKEIRLSDAEIQANQKIAIENGVVEFFGGTALGDKIIEEAALAGRTAIRLNSGMIMTEMMDASILMKIFGKGAKKSAREAAKQVYKHSRIAKPAGFISSTVKGGGTVLAAGGIEGVFEESGYNKYAEWKGLGQGVGNNFHGTDYRKRFLAGETVDDIFGGFLLSGGMSSFAEIGSALTKKAQFKEWEKGYINFKKGATPTTLKQFQDIITLQNNTLGNAEIAILAQEAQAQGKDSRPFTDKLIHNQALVAFQTGSTERLLQVYADIAKNNPDEAVRKYAQDAINEINVLEDMYNYAQEFENGDAIFELLSNESITENLAGELQQITDQTSIIANETLNKLNEKYDATYSVKNNQLVFTGKDQEAFKAEALKQQDIQNYVNIMNNLTTVNNRLNDVKKDLDKATNAEEQLKVRDKNDAIKETTDNYVEIFGLETKNRFERKIKSIAKKHGLKGTQLTEFINAANKEYSSYYINKQKSKKTLKNKTQKREVFKSDGVRKLSQKFNDLFKKKTPTDPNEDASPRSTSNFTATEKREIKNAVNEYAEKGQLSFTEMINKLIGKDDYTLTNEEKEANKKEVEDQFAMIVYGWQQNGYSDADFGATYQSNFGKIETKETKLLNKLKNIGKKAAEKIIPKNKFEEKQQLTEEKEANTPISTSAQELIKEKADKVVKSVKNSIHQLGKEIKLNVKMFTVNKKTGETTLMQNSNVDGIRLANPNKFNHGDKIGVAVFENSTENISIITRVKKQISVLVDKVTVTKVKETVEQPSSGLFNPPLGREAEGFFYNKYAIRKWNGASRTITIRKGDTFTFTEEQGKGNNVNYKSYDQRSPSNSNQHKNLISDDFLITNEDDFSMINDENVQFVRLKKVTNAPSKTDKSFIEVDVVDKNGKVIPKIIQIESELEQNIPIAVTDVDGTKLAWIDTPSGLLRADASGVQTLRQAQLETANFRKKIINGDIDQVTISKKTGSRYVPMSTKTSLEEQDPNVIVAIFDGTALKYNNNIFEQRNKRIIINKNSVDIHSGFSYELRKVGTNEKGVEEYIVSKIESHIDPLPDISAQNIEWVMKAYLTQFGNNKELSHVMTKQKRKQIQQALSQLDDKFDITQSGKKGVRNYLSHFTLTSINSKVLKKTKGFTDLSIDSEDRHLFLNFMNNMLPNDNHDTPVMVMRGKKILFGIITSEKSRKAQLNAGQPVTKIKEFQLTDGSTTTSIGLELNDKTSIMMIESLINNIGLQSKNFKRNHEDISYAQNRSVAKFDEFGNVEPISYKKFENTTLMTDVKGFAIESGGENFHVTATNVVITIKNGSKIAISTTSEPLSKQLPPSKSTIEALEQNPEVSSNEIETLVEVRNVLTLLGSKNTDKLFDDIVDGALTSSQKKEYKKKIETVPGVTSMQKYQLVMAFANHIMKKDGVLTKDIIDEALTTVMDEVLNPVKKEFTSLLDKLNALRDKNPLFQNINEIIAEFEEKMQMFDLVTEEKNKEALLLKTKDTLYKYLMMTQKDDTKENEQDLQAHIFSKESVEMVGKESIPTELKKLLAGIENVNEANEVIRGFLGVNTYVPFDETLNIIKSLIGTVPKSNMTFDEMMDVLTLYSKGFPFLSTIVTRLQNNEITPEHMRNKFMVNMVTHSMAMMHVSWKFNKKTNSFEVRVHNTNSSNVTKIIEDEWKSSFEISNLVTKNEKGETVIVKAKARELLNTYEGFKRDIQKKKELTPQEIEKWITKLTPWLSEFGITMSRKAMYDIIENGIITRKGQKIGFKFMFASGKKQKTLFSNLANKLQDYVNQKEPTNISEFPDEHPHIASSLAVNTFANIEGLYSTRSTISFRDGDKNLQGNIVPKFATDRVEDLKNIYDENGEVIPNGTQVRKDLLKDPYSSNSMLLSLLENNDDIASMLYVNHVAIGALKLQEKVAGDKNSITNLALGDQELDKAGFFTDTRQGKTNAFYEGIPLRMARMFFPTMSDKKQMLTMYMPVLDLNQDLMDSGLEISNALFEQTVIPELKRIMAFHSGEKQNMVGYNNAAQLFLLIPQLNELTFKGKKLIELLAKPNHGFSETEIVNGIKSQARTIIEGVIEEETTDKYNTWKSEGLIDAANNVKLSNEYLKVDGKPRYTKNESRNVVKDLVINEMLSLSNIYQIMGADIAQFASDKQFNNFGVDRQLVDHLPSMKKLFNFKEVSDELDMLLENNYIKQDEYNNIKEKLAPLPYVNEDTNAYVDLVESIGKNLGKRLALFLAPGIKVHNVTENYIQLFLNDHVDVASNIEHLVKLHYGKQGLETLKSLEGENIDAIAEHFPIISAFFAVDSTDAQEYTTINEHLDILLGLGKITRAEYENVLAKIEKGETIKSDEDLKIIFQPLKPVYSGSVFENGKMRMVYVKSSSYPLLPQVTQGTQLDKLRVAMETLEKKEGKRVRAAYKTAAKVGMTNTGIDLYGDLDNETLLESSVILDRNNFRIQQDVPVHALHTKEDEVLVGTQLMKLLFGNGVIDVETFDFMGNKVSGKDLLKTYNDTYGDIVNLAREELFDELGIDKDGRIQSEEVFLNNLSNILKQEAKSKNYPQQDIDGLTIIPFYDANGNFERFTFRNSIWLSTNSIRYEALMNSMITKKLIKLKLPGYSYVAGSQKGFEITADTKAVEENKSRMIYTKHFNGKELVATKDNNKAQIFISSKFRKADGEIIDLFEGIIYDDKNNPTNKEGKYIILDENDRWQLKDGAISDELLNITGFRIPTSSHVSAAQVEIAGFLPPESGDLMIVPKEFAVQKGLDYDVDKEFSYHLWHYENAEGKIVPIEQMIKEEDIAPTLIAEKKKLRKMKKAFNDNAKYNELVNEIATDEDLVITDQKLNKLLDKLDYDYKNLTIEQVQDQILAVKTLKNLKKKFLQNKLVRINSTVLSSPNEIVTKSINRVLSMDFADAQGDLIGGTKRKFKTLLSGEYQMEKMNLGAVGQMGIGVYSNYVVFNSLVQQTETPIYLTVKNEPVSITIGNYTSDGQLGRYTNLFDDKTKNKIQDLIKNESDLNKFKQGKLNFDELTKIVGTDVKLLSKIRTVAEAYAERQNTATDNEKAQIMGRVGVNSSTINVDSLLTLLGFDKGDTITDIDGNENVETSISYLLISQPIIKEYVRLVNKANSNVGKEYISKKNIAKGLINRYGGLGVNPESLTTQVLYDNIQVSESKEVQVAVLETFLQLEKFGGDMINLQKLMGITKKGLDKSMVNTIEFYEGIEALGTTEAFQDVTQLIGDYKSLIGLTNEQIDEYLANDYVVIGDQLVKPTTMMGHLLVTGTHTAYNLWTNMFPYTNTSFKRITNKIAKNSKQADLIGDAKIENIHLITKGLKKFLNSMPDIGIYNDAPINERRRLFLDEDGKPSLSAYLLKLRGINYKTIMDNTLLRTMFKFEIGTDGQISRLIFDNTAAHNFDEEQIYEAFADLITNEQSLPDNNSYEDTNEMLEIPSLTNLDKKLITSFDKSVVVLKTDNDMDIGEQRTTIVDNQRFTVTYLGEMTKDEYEKNGEKTFIVDNAKPKNKIGTIEKGFIDGEKRNVYKIESIYNTAKLAEDLITYAFLAGGTQDAIDFVKYIPLDYLEYIGYTNVMNKLDLNNQEIFSSIATDYVTQFFQHNPTLLNKLTIKKLNLKTTVNKANVIEFEAVANLMEKEQGEDYIMLDYFSMFDKAIGEDVIYMLTADGYIKLPQAGSHGMSEYDTTRKNVNSITREFEQNMLDPVAPKIEETVEVDNYDISSLDAETILKNIASREDRLGKLAGELLKVNDNSIKILVEELIGMKSGTYNATSHLIKIDKGIVDSTQKNQQAITFVHEFLHSLTSREVNKYFDPITGAPKIPISEMPEHVQDLNKLFEFGKKELGITDAKIQEVKDMIDNTPDATITPEIKLAYAFSNMKEFVTMIMTDDDVRNKLAEIKYKDKSILEKFSEFIKRAIAYINDNVNISYLDAVDGVVMNMIHLENASSTKEVGKQQPVPPTVVKPKDEILPGAQQFTPGMNMLEFKHSSFPRFTTRVINKNGKKEVLSSIDNGPFKVVDKKDIPILMKDGIDKFILDNFGQEIFDKFNKKLFTTTGIGISYSKEIDNRIQNKLKIGDILNVAIHSNGRNVIDKSSGQPYEYFMNITDEQGQDYGSVPYKSDIDASIKNLVEDGKIVTLKVIGLKNNSYTFELVVTESEIAPIELSESDLQNLADMDNDASENPWGDEEDIYDNSFSFEQILNKMNATIDVNIISNFGDTNINELNCKK